MRPRKHKPRSLFFETLESRELMAANITASLSGGVLRIEGTESSDKIYVLQSDGASQNVWVGSSAGAQNYGSFRGTGTGRVERIEILGLGGNDLIDLQGKGGAHHVKVHSIIWGDYYFERSTDGKDTITGGDGRDAIFGGGGDDMILGSNGGDYPVTGTQSIVQMLPVGNGILTLFSAGGAYFSPNGKDLGGGGSTIKAYTGTQSIVQLLPVGNGILTLFSAGGAYFSPNGKDLGGGGSTIKAYTGTQSIVQLHPVGNGILTLFSGGGAYFSPNGKDLGGGGSTIKAYTGTQSIVQMLPVGNGILTRFSGGGAYLSPNGKDLGGGGSTIKAYTGTQSIVQLLPVGNGILTLFSAGGAYFSPNGKDLGGGGSTIKAYTGTQSVVQLIPTENGVVTLFSGGNAYFSPNGKDLGGGGSTIRLGDNVTKTFSVYGHLFSASILVKWLQLGGVKGSLGLPTGDVFTTTGSTIQRFENGFLSRAASSTTVEVSYKGIFSPIAGTVDRVGDAVNTRIDLLVSSTTERIRQLINNNVLAIGNKGSTHVDELTFDQETGDIICKFTINAEHSWGRTNEVTVWNPVLQRREVLVPAQELSGGVQVEGYFHYNFFTNSFHDSKFEFDAEVGGEVGDALGELGWDKHIRFSIDAETIQAVQSIIEGDLTPLWTAAIDHLTSDEYNEFKKSYLAQFGGASRVYVASHDFVTWASPETLAAYGIAIGASAGAATPVVASAIMKQLESEYSDKGLAEWLQARAASYAEEIASEIFSALIQRRDVETGYFSIKWDKVQFNYGVGDMTAPVQHLGFAIIWKL